MNSKESSDGTFSRLDIVVLQLRPSLLVSQATKKIVG